MSTLVVVIPQIIEKKLFVFFRGGCSIEVDNERDKKEKSPHTIVCKNLAGFPG